MLSLNPAGEPIYRQIISQIRRMISSGQLAPGAELPSVRDIAQRFTVNPMTVSKAYSLLEAEGLIERQRGKPMRIAMQLPQTAAAQEQLLQPQLAQLILSAQQLNLSLQRVTELLNEQWQQAATSTSTATISTEQSKEL